MAAPGAPPAPLGEPVKPAPGRGMELSWIVTASRAPELLGNGTEAGPAGAGLPGKGTGPPGVAALIAKSV
ncbi:MAG TPA: hypothetical protein VEM39_10215 [Myxococcaceae bacterium]|nr:hypothetical protein [Myxococcaceae bacterium]